MNILTKDPAGEPGFAILAFKGDRNIQPLCTGMADVQQRMPISPLTNFRMASVSKQFTAMTILLLNERESLGLGKKLGHFFSDCHKNYKGITVKQLLTHTSGIWDYEPLIPSSREKQVLDEDVRELVNTSGKLYFRPGEKFQYSNTGYCLLALLASRISGSSYPKTVKELIFDPLAMSNSRIYEAGLEIPHRALGYIPGKDGFSGKNGFILNDQSITSATKGDGGVYTSLADYLKWHEALSEGKLLSPALMQEVFSAQVPVNNGVGYGYGWFSGKETDGSQCIFHSGETSGFLNMVYRNHSKKLLIALFSNRNDGSISGKFENAANRLGAAIQLEGFPKGQPPLFRWLSGQYG